MFLYRTGKCLRMMNNKWMMVSDIQKLLWMYHESSVQYITAC
ncbi:hypothetical protein HMPREF9445_00912 [Bacteroides clarus YIT 12056]|uniref:Uncharacterized protein n=1 Tax=Bacteroides clarus YIT 12056 TaxID=762984 RepID=A0ABP2KUH4_9BACE|nr:hypothetical protein HMPREF9445_00912 [Bacteroides clarus YIT 12056]